MRAGGTPFMEYLKKHLKETKTTMLIQHMIPLSGRPCHFIFLNVLRGM